METKQKPVNSLNSVMGAFQQGLCFSYQPDLDQIVPDESLFWSAQLSSWIASKSDRLLFFKHVEKQKPIKNRRPVVVLVVRGSPEGPLSRTPYGAI